MNPLRKCKVDSDLSNHATKSDLKNTTGADTSDYTERCHFAGLKSDIDKLDIDKIDGLTSFKGKVDKII